MAPDGTRSEVGLYSPTGVVGRGGMGTVLRATAPDGTEVAVKTFSDATDPRLADAIRREVVALETLEHANIVRIIESDVDAEIPWYAMELIDGRSLTSIIAGESDHRAATLVDFAASAFRKTTPEPEVAGAFDADTRIALGWVGQICHALAYLHGEGFVHGDLKSSNVIVQGPRAVLVDFGLAARIESRLTGSALRRATTAGHTPAYTAPERYHRAPLEPRSDLYSLGCLLFEVVAKRRPFTGTKAEIARAHLEQPPPHLRDAVPTVPDMLDDLVRRLLAKRPSDRPRNAMEVVEILESLGIETTLPDVSIPTPRQYLHPPGVVGRDDEVEALRYDIESACAGHGRSKLVLGPAGTGKSTLAGVAVRVARSFDMDVIIASGTSGDASTPLSGMRGALDALHAYVSHHPAVAGVDEADVHAIATIDGRFTRQQDRPPATLQAATGAFTSLFERMCAGEPTLLVVDDVQWLDQESRAALRELVRLAPAYRWLVLTTGRSDELSETELAELSTLHSSTVELSNLGPAELRVALESMTGRRPPEEVIAIVESRTSGNPFHVRELLEVVVNESNAAPATGEKLPVLDLTRLVALAPEPAAIEQLTRSRVGRLSADLLDVARVAALIGPVVDLFLLSRVLGRPITQLYATTEALVRRGVFAAPINPNEAEFRHELLHEAAIAATDREERRAIHGLIADTLLKADESGEHIARHLEAAGRSREAIEHWRAAARRSTTMHAHRRAADRWGDAIRAADDAGATADERLSLHCGRVEALCSAGEYAVAREELLDVDISNVEPSENRVRLLLSMAEIRRSTGDPAGSGEAAEQARQEASTLELTKLRHVSMLAVSEAMSETDAERSIELCNEVIVESDSDTTLVRAHNNLALLHYGYGNHDAALDAWTAALGLLRESESTGQQIDVFMNIGNVYTDRGRADDALLWLDRARELAEDTADRYRLAWIRMNLGVVHGLRNDYRRARECYEAALKHHRRVDARVPMINCLVNIAADLIELGAHDEAVTRLEEAISESTQADYRRGLIYSEITLGEACLYRGHLTDARTHLESALRSAADVGDGYTEFVTRARLAWVESIANASERASEHLNRAEDLARELRNPSVNAELALACGIARRNDDCGADFEAAFEGFLSQQRRWHGALVAACAIRCGLAGGWPRKLEALATELDLPATAPPRTIARNHSKWHD